MDELVHHCLRELAFDGDLGCDILRLTDFIVEFYDHNRHSETDTQLVDGAFCTFFWSVLVQQPTIRIGLVPPGTTSEVYIAPQVSAKKKEKASPEETVEATPPVLQVIPDAKTKSLEALTAEYGDNLRIAVEPHTIFAAITGSHLRPSKLSPMVYSALQLITRGREDGVSVVDLGKKSGYDQKTCFYLIKQLTILDLVVKVRRGGVGSHFCIHKYFFQRSNLWQQIREEETKADSKFTGLLEQEESSTAGLPTDETQDGTTLDLHFEPMDARHLSSLPLVRARVVKLLKASKNYMHTANNVMLTLGFSNPTKTDRRFFATRIRDLIQQGVIEKVLVPNTRKNNSIVKCLRLVTSEADGGEVNAPTADSNDAVDESDFDDSGPSGSQLKTNLTVHKHISNLLEEAATKGMTLHDISAAMSSFDKRTIELLLTRAERNLPAPHLHDLGVAGLMETYGRERRHRYYTVAAYRALLRLENLDDSATPYSAIDLSKVGQFGSFDPHKFYNDDAGLSKFQDEYVEKGKAKDDNGQPPKKRGRPPKVEGEASPRKGDNDGTKDKQEGQGEKRSRKRKRHDTTAEPAEEGVIDPQPDPTRRSPKKRKPYVADSIKDGLPLPVQDTPKKSGRPRKAPLTSTDKGSVIGISDLSPSVQKTPKKRGRPRKTALTSLKAVPDTGSDLSPSAQHVFRAQGDPIVSLDTSTPGGSNAAAHEGEVTDSHGTPRKMVSGETDLSTVHGQDDELVGAETHPPGSISRDNCDDASSIVNEVSEFPRGKELPGQNPDLATGKSASSAMGSDRMLEDFLTVEEGPFDGSLSPVPGLGISHSPAINELPPTQPRKRRRHSQSGPSVHNPSTSLQQAEVPATHDNADIYASRAVISPDVDLNESMSVKESQPMEGAFTPGLLSLADSPTQLRRSSRKPKPVVQEKNALDLYPPGKRRKTLKDLNATKDILESSRVKRKTVSLVPEQTPATTEQLSRSVERTSIDHHGADGPTRNSPGLEENVDSNQRSHRVEDKLVSDLPDSSPQMSNTAGMGDVRQAENSEIPVDLNEPIPVDPLLMKDMENSVATSFLIENNKESGAATIHEELAPALIAGGHPIASPTSNLPEAQTRTQTYAQCADDITAKGPRAKVNVSHLRRENELLRVLEELGGLANLNSKEFGDAHVALLAKMSQTGEPTSAPPGTRFDKRTISNTLGSLEDKGRVKFIKTTVPALTGASRPVSVVYLPGSPQEKINKFLKDLSRTSATSQPPPIKKIEDRIDYGFDRTQPTKSALPLQLLQADKPSTDEGERWSRNNSRAQQLFSYDDDTIREVLLTERTTLSQFYGFILGKALRAKKLHLLTLSLFEDQSQPSSIISSQQRVVPLSFYYQDIATGDYFSIVANVIHDEELKQLIDSPEGRKAPVRQLPARLHTLSHVGRSRSRGRILELLELLQSLGLVTPLASSTSDHLAVATDVGRDRLTGYDILSSSDWTPSAPMLAPQFWQFQTSAPVHLWALSETSPPFWKTMSTATTSDAVLYWSALEMVARDRECAERVLKSISSFSSEPDGALHSAKTLRREISWNADYNLTWHQCQYLKTFVDGLTGHTPLDANDRDLILQKICWVISAPLDAVSRYFAKARLHVEKEVDKARKRATEKVPKTETNVQESQAQLAKKITEAKARRESEWENILSRVHPEPLPDALASRVDRLRTRYLQARSVKDSSKWEAEIQLATGEANLTIATFLKRPSVSAVSKSASQANPNTSDKSVTALVEAQASLAPLQKARKKNKKDSEGESNIQVGARRSRFLWTRDYDELAIDAIAILRARSRHLPRVELNALEQVFPHVPKNSIRQRIFHINESRAKAAYLKRLEDRWYHLWVEHRGSDHLPDSDPYNPSKFDLIKHIEFLRKEVDKNALRVGFVQVDEAAIPKIPETVQKLHEQWDVVDLVDPAPRYDFLWTTVVEEGREKTFLKQAFTTSLDVHHPVSDDPVCIAESALKMCFGTPKESYDAFAASKFLHSIGAETVTVATSNLLNRGVLSKLNRDPKKSKPGRSLKISEINQNALGGSMSRDVFTDASALEEISTQQGDAWREWPLLSSDGDMAGLIQLVSDNKVSFTIDTTEPRNARTVIDWNSRKADDDQIEPAIRVRFHNVDSAGTKSPTPAPSPTSSVTELASDSDLDHGNTTDSSPAVCWQFSDGPVDCLACYEHGKRILMRKLSGSDKILVHSILEILDDVGANGISKNDLISRLAICGEDLGRALEGLVLSDTPLAFWAGYAIPLLVCARYLQAWTVKVSESPMTRVFPRRWLDISGIRINDIWQAALRAVLGIVLFHPGISQKELRWRARSIYDRQEVLDIVNYLETQQFLEQRIDPGSQSSYHGPAFLDDEDDKLLHWFVKDSGKHWHNVS